MENKNLVIGILSILLLLVIYDDYMLRSKNRNQPINHDLPPVIGVKQS